jgi:hypothetical protein
MFNLDAIDNHFPIRVNGRPSYRDGQKKAIEFALDAFNQGKRIVILEGPTGSGKSAIGMTLADMVPTSYYLTATKILQDQLVHEFADIVELKGRNAYPCTFYRRFGPEMVRRGLWRQHQLDAYLQKAPGCDAGFCKSSTGKSQSKNGKCLKCFTASGPNGNGHPGGDLSVLPPGMKYSACPYYEQVFRAVKGRKVAMNFSSFLFQTQMTNRFDDPPRDLLIIDECLHPHTHVITENGRIPIGTLVNTQMRVKVASYNTKTGEIEYKPITRWLKRSKQSTYKVLAGNRVLYPTADHKIYTPTGKKKLQELRVGDQVLVQKPEITSQQEQLVLGSLLGDANLHVVESKRISKKYVCKGTRARVRFRHGPKQLEYIEWKYRILQPHAKTVPVPKPSAGFTKTTVAFNTSCDFMGVAESVLVDGRKSPNSIWLSQITELGLAVWYMDDGGLSGGTARFNTHGFTKVETGLLADWLFTRWGISAKVKDTHKNGNLLHYLQLNRHGTYRLAGLIGQFIPPSMRYKLPINRLYQWADYNIAVEHQKCNQVIAAPIILIEPYKETITYDLEVEDNHNYFAGNTLVSNCHQAEPQLLDFVSLTVSDANLSQFGIYIPELASALEYATWFTDTKVGEHIYKAIEVARRTDQHWLEDELSRTLKKYKMFLDHVQNTDAEWVCEYEEVKSTGSHRVTLKPVYVHGMAHSLLFRYGKRVVLMSATVLDVDVMCRSLGIDRDHVAAFRMKNRFPVENRPIYLRTVAKMTGGRDGMHAWGPELVKGVNAIVSQYPGKRGIIHTHNFAIQELLKSRCDQAVRDRFLLQQNYRDKKEMLDAHALRNDSVIVAPAMHEGLDLSEDLSRFQIICKVPWPNFFDNEQLSRRVEVDHKYLIWLTALKLVQSYGRSIRSETDTADTYILDEGIYKFLNQAKKMLPDWFQEALRE